MKARAHAAHGTLQQIMDEVQAHKNEIFPPTLPMPYKDSKGAEGEQPRRVLRAEARALKEALAEPAVAD